MGEHECCPDDVADLAKTDREMPRKLTRPGPQSEMGFTRFIKLRAAHARARLACYGSIRCRKLRPRSVEVEQHGVNVTDDLPWARHRRTSRATVVQMLSNGLPGLRGTPASSQGKLAICWQSGHERQAATLPLMPRDSKEPPA